MPRVVSNKATTDTHHVVKSKSNKHGPASLKRPNELAGGIYTFIHGTCASCMHHCLARVSIIYILDF
jgi:hypothetical protein